MIKEIAFGVVLDEEGRYHVASFSDLDELNGTYTKGFDTEEEAQEEAEAMAVDVAAKVLVMETEASLGES